VHADESSSSRPVIIWNSSIGVQEPLPIHTQTIVSTECTADSMSIVHASLRFRCVDGIWHPHRPACVPRLCRLDKPISNAIFFLTDPSASSVVKTPTFGTSVELEHDQLLQVQCQSGFRLQGANALRCFYGELSAVFVHSLAQQEHIYRHASALDSKPHQHHWWPKCLARRCPDPPTSGEIAWTAPSRASDSNDWTDQVEQIAFACSQHPKQPISRSVCVDGEWRPPINCLNQTAENHSPVLTASNSSDSNRPKATATRGQEEIETQWIQNLLAEDQLELKQLKRPSNTGESFLRKFRWCRSPEHLTHSIHTWIDRTANQSKGSHLIGFVELSAETNRSSGTKTSTRRARVEHFAPGALLLFRCLMEGGEQVLAELDNVQLFEQDSSRSSGDTQHARSSWMLRCSNGSWVGQRTTCYEQPGHFRRQLIDLQVPPLQFASCQTSVDELLVSANSSVLAFYQQMQLNLQNKTSRSALPAGSVITLRCEHVGLYRFHGTYLKSLSSLVRADEFSQSSLRCLDECVRV
jgi:hypothetical protein